MPLRSLLSDNINERNSTTFQILTPRAAEPNSGSAHMPHRAIGSQSIPQKIQVKDNMTHSLSSKENSPQYPPSELGPSKPDGVLNSTLESIPVPQGSGRPSGIFSTILSRATKVIVKVNPFSYYTEDINNSDNVSTISVIPTFENDVSTSNGNQSFPSNNHTSIVPNTSVLVDPPLLSYNPGAAPETPTKDSAFNLAPVDFTLSKPLGKNPTAFSNISSSSLIRDLGSEYSSPYTTTVNIGISSLTSPERCPRCSGPFSSHSAFMNCDVVYNSGRDPSQSAFESCIESMMVNRNSSTISAKHRSAKKAEKKALRKALKDKRLTVERESSQGDRILNDSSHFACGGPGGRLPERTNGSYRSKKQGPKNVPTKPKLAIKRSNDAESAFKLYEKRTAIRARASQIGVYTEEGGQDIGYLYYIYGQPPVDRKIDRCRTLLLVNLSPEQRTEEFVRSWYSLYGEARYIEVNQNNSKALVEFKNVGDAVRAFQGPLIVSGNGGCENTRVAWFDGREPVYSEIETARI